MPSPSLNANNKPSWPIRFLKGVFSTRIEPETYEQEQGITMTKYGLVSPHRTKSGKTQFGEFSSNQFVIESPSAGKTIDSARALANNKGFVYASVNAKAREVMNIDWRLFEVDGEDHTERPEHEVLDLLDSVNDNMTGFELKYLISACLDLTGNAYLYLEGVKGDMDKAKAIHLMPPDKVRPVIDKRSWPYQLVGFKFKTEAIEMQFQPYEVIHFRLPNPGNFFEGMGGVQAGAEYIDNDNYAMEFNRKFFINGARPAGFLESDMVSETQIEVLKIGFANMHEGVDNMNRIGVLPKGVKWTPSGSNPKDMDFKNMSEDMRDRILAMFGVSRTILGTAESDTNRATAETADYVFSKRVVKPHMTLICGFLNEKLIPRYGDDLYITFIDPVPEDKAFRTIEMQAAVGSQPVLTPNEARDEFMGLGPVDGGDTLFVSTSFAPVGEAQEGGDVNADEPGNANADASKAVVKDFKPKLVKAANGQRVAFRLSRTKLQKRAQARKEMAQDLADKIKGILEEAAKHPRFSTKAQDETVTTASFERTSKAEAEIRETVVKLNGEQQKEVQANLKGAIKANRYAEIKAIDPTKLFNLDKWISITTNALTPIMENLFETEGKAAAEEIGKPSLNPLSDQLAKEALHESIQKMSGSYQQTVLTQLEKTINEGLAEGQPLSEIAKGVNEVYEAADAYSAERLAKTEAFRTTNASLKAAWQQSGVVKTVRWYTSEKSNVCPFCQEIDGKEIGINDVFFKDGESMTAGEDGTQSMTFNYGDVGAPPLHPLCACFIRPESVSLD